MGIGGILTAMVTPFDANGDLDEDATVRLMRFLLENGSDGLVVAGSTGEAATLTDEEKVRLWELAVSETPQDTLIVAGTGTYDTRHTVELTERAHEAGVDAMLVVTPYYVKPNRRGLLAHYEAVATAINSTEGFTIVLCALKALLEHGSAMNLVNDKALLLESRRRG